MRKRLIDTTVWIDWLRGVEDAAAYVAKLDNGAELSVLVLGELMAGARKKRQLEAIVQLPEFYNTISVDVEVAMLGGEYFMQYAPSHGCGFVDCLIAATAKRHGMTLVTHNRKHFPMLEDIETPY